jgi:hypothetical protein
MERKSIMTLILAAAFLALLFTSPVEAGNKRYKAHKNHKQVQKHSVHRAALPAFVVPARMHNRHRVDYRPFNGGDVYFRPHGHYHAIYIFPVHTRRGVVYREFEYCRGDMFVRNQISYRGTNVSFNIGF